VYQTIIESFRAKRAFVLHVAFWADFYFFAAKQTEENSKSKAKLTVNFLAFPTVKFRKIWQTGNECFTLVGAHF